MKMFDAHRLVDDAQLHHCLFARLQAGLGRGKGEHGGRYARTHLAHAAHAGGRSHDPPDAVGCPRHGIGRDIAAIVAGQGVGANADFAGAVPKLGHLREQAHAI